MSNEKNWATFESFGIPRYERQPAVILIAHLSRNLIVRPIKTKYERPARVRWRDGGREVGRHRGGRLQRHVHLEGNAVETLSFATTMTRRRRSEVNDKDAAFIFANLDQSSLGIKHKSNEIDSTAIKKQPLLHQV